MKGRGTEVGIRVRGHLKVVVVVFKRNLVEPDRVAVARVEVTDRVIVRLESLGDAVRALGELKVVRPSRHPALADGGHHFRTALSEVRHD